MFFIKFFYFLKGYVIIRVYGASVERFISICLARGIKLLELDRSTDGIMCVISNVDFMEMPEIASKCRVKVRIVERHGLYLLLRMAKKRMGFVLGALIFPVIIFIMSQFVWSVQINGVDKEKADEVRSNLFDMGIHEGVKVSELPCSSEVKFNLLEKIDGISWAWMYVEGTKVRVELREGIPIPDVPDESLPCDIVAVSAGLVENIVVEKGKGIVKTGDAVLEGDILIAGTIELPKSGGYYTTHADGRVIAKTSHTASGEFSLYREYKKYLDTKKRYTIKLFGWNIPLYRNTPVEFETYDKKEELWEATLGSNFHLGFGIIRDTYTETHIEKEELPYETAVEIARGKLEEEISKELTPGAQLFDSSIYTEKRDDTVYVSLTMNFTENIGAKKIFE